MTPVRTVEGVEGLPRSERGRGNGSMAKQSPVHDRGPRHLTDMEGDFVHAVGLMNACYMFSVRSFETAVRAYVRREGVTQAEAAARMGVPATHLNDWLGGRKRPSHAALLKLRELMCGDQLPSSHDVTRHTHRV